MDSKQIDVMVADASHEAYVDTICQSAWHGNCRTHSRICRNKDEGRESNHRLVRR